MTNIEMNYLDYTDNLEFKRLTNERLMQVYDILAIMAQQNLADVFQKQIELRQARYRAEIFRRLDKPSN